jgi:quinoprotein glucose dehydrogenase
MTKSVLRITLFSDIILLAVDKAIRRSRLQARLAPLWNILYVGILTHRRRRGAPADNNMADRRAYRLIVLRAYSALLIAVGLILMWGGAQLLALGGSRYYLFTGLMTVVAGVQAWRRKRAAAALYGILLLATVAWAIYEVGFDGWALAPRVLPPLLGGVLLVGLWRWQQGAAASTGGPLSSARTRFWPVWAAVLIIAAGGVGAIGHARRPHAVDPVYQAGIGGTAASLALPASGGAGADWPAYGGDAASTRYSALAEINAENVEKLQVAWTYRVGPTPLGKGPPTGLEVTPLKIDDTLYVCSSYNDVIALDAESGRERWRFRSNIDIKDVPFPNCRGLAYFRTAAPDCPQRIITNTVSAELIALDAQTGRPCTSFGSNGRVSLLAGMGEVKPGYYYVSSAPTLVRGNVVLGGWVFDNQYWGEPSGVIRAFDATTGRLAWAWDMGNPDRKGAPPAGEAYTPSTPNSWAPMSADEELGLVYVPMGNSVPDAFGAQRRPFDDEYSSSVVALDAATGDVRWSFQTVHHDLWDYDVGSPPTLVDIPTGNGMQRALLQPTKRGEIFVLDRRTGTPLSRVEERAAPQQGGVPEERLAPTQPYSADMPAFGGPPLTEEDMWGLTPLDQLWCRIEFKRARYEGQFTPPGLAFSITYPGYFGGSAWGGVSVDLRHDIMIVNSLRLAVRFKLYSRSEADFMGIHPIIWSQRGTGVEAHPAVGAQSGTPYAVEIVPFFSPLAIPCQRPPYAMLSAVDLRTHKLLWNRRFGTAREAGPFGIHSHLPLTMGVPEQGGSIATAGGLVFIGASQDQRFRAFSSTTGQLLWEDRLPAGGNATPMTYQAPRSGRQMVVIAAGGSYALLSNMGDYIVAYALPGAAGR